MTVKRNQLLFFGYPDSHRIGVGHGLHIDKSEVGARPGIGEDWHSAEENACLIVDHRFDADIVGVVVHQTEVADLCCKVECTVEINQTKLMTKLVRQYAIEYCDTAILAHGFRNKNCFAQGVGAVAQDDRIIAADEYREQIVGRVVQDIELPAGAGMEENHGVVVGKPHGGIRRNCCRCVLNKLTQSKHQPRVAVALAAVVRDRVRHTISAIFGDREYDPVEC